MNKLLPCPFCGSSADEDCTDHGAHSISCSECGARISALTHDDACRDWNYRHSGWVSVTDKLPEVDVEILCYCCLTRMFFTGFMNRDKRFYTARINHLSVTHWQPIPDFANFD